MYKLKTIFLNRNCPHFGTIAKISLKSKEAESGGQLSVKKFPTAASSSHLAFQADSREIMQYLQDSNLISSLRQTHPHAINNQESVGGEAARGTRGCRGKHLREAA